MDPTNQGKVARYLGAAAGLVPVVGPIAQEFTESATQAVLAEHARARSVALRAAEESSGLTREEISDLLVQKPAVVPLVTRVLFLAGMNGHDEILEMLGGVLGSILLAPDDTEEAELILAGIADLKRIHLQVLRVLHQPPQARVKASESSSPKEQYGAARTDEGLPHREPDAEGYVMQDADTWNAEALAFITGLALTRTQLALAGLMNSGFALSPAVLDGPGYCISPAGEVVYEAVQRWQSRS